jgi:hypothetical protein
VKQKRCCGRANCKEDSDSASHVWRQPFRIFDLVRGANAVARQRNSPATVSQDASNRLCEALTPGDRKYSNVRFILQTKVIKEVAGQPKVVAAYLSR